MLDLTGYYFYLEDNGSDQYRSGKILGKVNKFYYLYQWYQVQREEKESMDLPCELISWKILKESKNCYFFTSQEDFINWDKWVMKKD